MRILRWAPLLLVLAHLTLGKDAVQSQAPTLRIIPVTTDGSAGRGRDTDEGSQPPTSIENGDFVKLSRYGGMVALRYDVTVSRSGDVNWNGIVGVRSLGVIHSKVKPEAAHALIQKFLDPRIWALRRNYSRAITDASGTILQLQIGNQTKTIRNYANSAPEWVQEFEDAIDAAANTHRWRHGRPRSEPLSNIVEDGVIPKPGVTPLMRAAAGEDIEAVREALPKDAALDATDASGWTALMYAAVRCEEPVQLLLDAGANPNYQSPRGDTPLMAAAISGEFCEDLVKGGAQINAQNSSGITALMILAAYGNPEEVKDALSAGADPLVRDAEGRSALDHLRLASRGKSPIFPFQDSDSMNDKDVNKVESLLKAATRNRGKGCQGERVSGTLFDRSHIHSPHPTHAAILPPLSSKGKSTRHPSLPA